MDHVNVNVISLIQSLILDQGEFGGSISSASSPDGNLNYNELVESAVKVSKCSLLDDTALKSQQVMYDILLMLRNTSLIW